MAISGMAAFGRLAAVRERVFVRRTTVPKNDVYGIAPVFPHRTIYRRALRRAYVQAHRAIGGGQDGRDVILDSASHLPPSFEEASHSVKGGEFIQGAQWG